MIKKTTLTIDDIEYEKEYWSFTVGLVSIEKKMPLGTTRMINGHLFFVERGQSKGIFNEKYEYTWKPVELEGIRMTEKRHEKILQKIQKDF